MFLLKTLQRMSLEEDESSLALSQILSFGLRTSTNVVSCVELPPVNLEDEFKNLWAVYNRQLLKSNSLEAVIFSISLHLISILTGTFEEEDGL